MTEAASVCFHPILGLLQTPQKHKAPDLEENNDEASTSGLVHEGAFHFRRELFSQDIATKGKTQKNTNWCNFLYISIN
jgi:hypothetical protein